MEERGWLLRMTRTPLSTAFRKFQGLYKAGVILSAAKDPRLLAESREADPSSFLLRMTTRSYRDRYLRDGALSQALLGARETVLDVPPAVSRRVRLLSDRSGRKTDAADAVSTARAATGPGVRLIRQADGVHEALRC
jgi:hypothetical protein